MTVARYRRFLGAADKEYGKYEKTKNEDFLAEAGEKLWNAFQMLMETLSGKKIRSYGDLKKVLVDYTNDDVVIETQQKVYRLHVFFYRGWTEDITEISDAFLMASANMVIIEKKYGVRK